MFVQPTLAAKGYIAQKVMNVMNSSSGASNSVTGQSHLARGPYVEQD